MNGIKEEFIRGYKLINKKITAMFFSDFSAILSYRMAVASFSSFQAWYVCAGSAIRQCCHSRTAKAVGAHKGCSEDVIKRAAPLRGVCVHSPGRHDTDGRGRHCQCCQ